MYRDDEARRRRDREQRQRVVDVLTQRQQWRGRRPQSSRGRLYAWALRIVVARRFSIHVTVGEVPAPPLLAGGLVRGEGVLPRLLRLAEFRAKFAGLGTVARHHGATNRSAKVVDASL